MRISLGLLWLCFQINHGEITRCLVGGLYYDEDLCKKLINESVFNRFYISSFQREILGNNKNMNDVYDTPYSTFKENTEVKAMTPNRLSREVLNVANELKNNFVIFRQSIIVDNHDQIHTQWNDALSLGTDTYRLKYHNVLYNNLKSGKIKLSSKAFMVLIQSYYNAASTHYFSRDYNTAHILIEEGLIFFKSEQKQLQDDDGISNENLTVWNALYLILKEDIENIMNNKETEAENQLVSNLNKILLTNEKYIPSSAALFFRRYFLDPNMDDTVKRVLESLSPKYKIWEPIENDNMYTKNISMHYFLVFSIFGKEIEDRVGNIIKAIQRPVLCVEDRLLNYEANKLALEMLHHCLNENTKSSSDNSSCKELKKLTITNSVLRKTIIPKLIKESYVEYHKKNPIKELYTNLSTNDTIIDEKILHVIVTAAIDFIDINSEKFKQIKSNIKLAIKFLEKYVEGQMQKLQRIKKTNNRIISGIKKKVFENNNTTNIDECDAGSSVKDVNNKTNELKENIHEYDLPQKNINYDTEEHLKAVYSTDYSDNGIRIKNIFIALKWLAELNGVLCNKFEPDILHYQKELKLSIDRATKFVSNYKENNYIFANEDHLSYLRLKRKAKILAPVRRWEVSNWLGGWISSKKNKITLITLDYATFNDQQSEMYTHLDILKHNNYYSDSSYINKIELNILLYRYVKKTYPGQYDKMYPYIKNAIDEVVITSEDRVRNMEAHELFSRYLMQRNRDAIEKGKNLSSADELYKTYLKPPIDEDQQRNGSTDHQMDEEDP